MPHGTRPCLSLALESLEDRRLLAVTYYVSSIGSDDNNGLSIESAFRTVARVNKLNLNAGDKVLFKGGETFAGTLSLTSEDAGTGSSPVTISTFGSTRATLHGGDASAISAYNVAGIRVQFLNVRGNGAEANSAHGISFYNDLSGDVKLDYVRIDRVMARGFGGAGVGIGGYNGLSGFRTVKLTKVDARENGRAGIMVYGAFDRDSVSYANQNVYIGWCKAYDNPGIAGYPTNSGSGIVIGGVDGATIERCLAWGNGRNNTFVGGPVGIWAWDSRRVAIQHNESYRNRTASSADGGGFALDGGVSESVLQYNYSHDNDGAGFGLFQYQGARPWHDNVVRYNVSEDDGRKNSYGGIHLWAAEAGNTLNAADVHHNTVFVSPSAIGSPRALRLDAPTASATFRNNVLVTTGGKRLVHASLRHDSVRLQGNAYWSSGSAFSIRWGSEYFSSLSTWQSATGQETLAGVSTGLVADPRLTAPGQAGAIGSASALEAMTAYLPLSDSPLVDAALDLSAFDIARPDQDFAGTVLADGSLLDIGAFELVAV